MERLDHRVEVSTDALHVSVALRSHAGGQVARCHAADEDAIHVHRLLQQRPDLPLLLVAPFLGGTRLVLRGSSNLELFNHLVELVGQEAQFIAGIQLDAPLKVSARHIAGGGCQFADIPRNR